MSACRERDVLVEAALSSWSLAGAEPHLQECVGCAAAVRRAMSFDTELRLAARSLVLETLPAAHHLLVDGGIGSRTLRRSGLAGLASAAFVTAFATLALVVGMAGRFGGMVPSGVGGVPDPSVTVAPGVAGVTSSTTPMPSASPIASASARPSPTAQPSVSAQCVGSFALAVKTWASSGQASLPVSSSFNTARLGSVKPILVKVFAACSADELRLANGQITFAYPVKVAGTSGARVEPMPLLQDVDRTVFLWCSDQTLSGLRTCTTIAASTSPPAVRSP